MHACGDDGRAGADTLAVRKPHPAVLTRAHEAESGARFIAEFMPPQGMPRRQYGNQQAVSGVGFHLHAIDKDAQGRSIRHNRAHQSAIHDCLNLFDTAARMLAEHAAPFNPAFDSRKVRPSICFSMCKERFP
jgi:hypothetical protein